MIEKRVCILLMFFTVEAFLLSCVGALREGSKEWNAVGFYCRSLQWHGRNPTLFWDKVIFKALG